MPAVVNHLRRLEMRFVPDNRFGLAAEIGPLPMPVPTISPPVVSLREPRRPFRRRGCFSRILLFQKADVALLGRYSESSRSASRGATCPSIKTTFLPGLGERG